MDDWHARLASTLSGAPQGPRPDALTALEIAFGRARSAVAYALELARAHRLPATGSVAGDSIWLHLGASRLRMTLNRMAGRVDVLRPGRDEESAGADADLGAVAREAIDEMVRAWSALSEHPAEPGAASPPYHEDEPTRA